jgi:GTPase SAR1 family protein
MHAAAWSPRGDVLAAIVSDHPAQFDDETDATYSTYGIQDEDDVIAQFERGDFGPVSVGADGPEFVRFFDAESALQLGTLSSRFAKSRPYDLAWRDDSVLLTASDEGTCEWQSRDGHFLGFLDQGGEERFHGIDASSERDFIAAIGEATVAVWGSGGELLTASESETEGLTCVSFAPNGARFAVGGESGVVDIWDASSGDQLRALEGHTGSVTSVSFSPDNALLATASADGKVRIWETTGWTLLSETLDSSMLDLAGHVRFAPEGHVLALHADAGRSVRLMELDMATLAARQRRPRTVHYTNAKVVLLGDSSVGKTGLGLVLTGQTFRATESTHRRNVWLLSSEASEGPTPERKEIFLWDLAGQPGYRLLHQLHLGDVAVAAVVFDARSEVDPLAGVRHWARALSQAERQADVGGHQIQRILVAARMDRGGTRVSDDELRAARRAFGFDKYVTTSAKEGGGITTLREEIERSVDWASLPKVSSTELFESIRAFLLNKRHSDLPLATETELRHAFAATGLAEAEEVQAEFRTCVERAQARGLVRRLSFGGLVLLRPEVLDAYAAAALHAAGAQPDGLGAIPESDVREARFPIPTEDRLEDAAVERLLLIATIEDLLRHEVALREDAGEGSYLVFPTQTTRNLTPEEDLTAWCKFEFEGPLQHVWATLVVRLAHSGVFTMDDVGAACAIFRGVGRTFALRLTPVEEGRAELECLTEGPGDSDLERLFEQFIWTHLHRRALRDSVTYSRLTACSACGFVVPGAMIEALKGAETMNCPTCPATIAVAADGRPSEEPDSRSAVRALQRSADDERGRLAARTIVQGKEAIHEFDTFLAHSNRDKEAVRAVADRLRDIGLNPWLDVEQIPPGRWFQTFLQDAVSKVASGTIVIGQHGLGPWQALEVRMFVSQCVDREIPVIPVLLPEATLPPEASFLKELQYVEFRDDVEELEPFARLAWGITGDRALYHEILQKSRGTVANR